MIPASDPRAPHYWQHETSGVLRPAIGRLLDGAELAATDIVIIRAYFRQWVDSPVWDENPHAGEDDRRLANLRKAARDIASRADIRQWLRDALAMGIDPL